MYREPIGGPVWGKNRSKSVQESFDFIFKLEVKVMKPQTRGYLLPFRPELKMCLAFKIGYQFKGVEVGIINTGHETEVG